MALALLAASAAIIAHSAERITVQVDPRAYRFEIRMNVTALPPDTVVAFNANYFWRGRPIGLCSGFDFIPAYVAERPVLDLDAMKFGLGSNMIQAGPTLLRGGLETPLDGTKRSEHFKDDVYRKCPHVAVGVSKAGKLVVTYAPSWTVKQLSSYMATLPLTDAMNVDGGHSAMLYVAGRRYGNQGKVPVAVLVRPRKPR